MNEKESEKKIPTSLRALNIAVGLAAIILSIVVVAYPALALYTLILILLVALPLIGVARLLVGLLARYLPKRTRAIRSRGLTIPQHSTTSLACEIH